MKKPSRVHYGPRRGSPVILQDLGPLTNQPPGAGVPLRRFVGVDRRTFRGLWAAAKKQWLEAGQ